MKKPVFFFILFLVSVRLTAGDDFCGIRNNSFRTGEKFSLIVFYSALGLYVNAGTANLTVTSERLLNKPVYHIIGTGVTNSSYDWIFKVRDRYETYIDTGTLQPYKFKYSGNHSFYQAVILLPSISIYGSCFCCYYHKK